MGGTASTQVGAAISVQSKTKKIVDQEGMINLLMPVYYTQAPLLDHEKASVLRSWKLIASGVAPEFHRRKKADPKNTPCTSPPEFFGKQLIKRFISVHPVSEQMFTNTTTKQGTLSFRMISFIISALEDEKKFDSHFVMLTKGHNRLGVRAVEYGIFGEALFYVLRLTLGDDYDAHAHNGWVKIYSRILRIIIPIVVDYELNNKAVVDQLTAKRLASMPVMRNVPTVTVLAEHDTSDDKSVTTVNTHFTSIMPSDKTK